MTDYELLEIDRIAKIQSINKQYDLENNAYLSFSGGKDSTVLHYLLDLALPGNKIPRLFINTGIEYEYIVDFVKKLEQKDSRIQIVNSNVNIKKMLEIEGYPFKSKEHSLKLGEWQKGSIAKSNIYYKEMSGKSRYACPKKLLYQYERNFKLRLSDKCCYRLKKDISHKWEKENNKNILLTGMLKEEGGQRSSINCIVTDKKNNLKKFHPLAVVTKSFENWFIETHNIKLCKLYYPPFNFERTGCKGCPFALDLQNQLDVMERLLPAEKAQCEKLWAPVYEEYRRINFRLKNQTTIFDFISTKLKVLELFGGIGACTAALKRLGIDFEVADYVEIDKYAVASYNAINKTNFEPQDITKWDKDIEVDLIMSGSPCQDFSLAGLGKGGDKGSGTRSSLMYENIRIIEKLKPKYVIWENVKNLLSKKHIHNFNAYLEAMEQLGYNNFYQVLNAKDYGIPQNRERVFTISIRKDINKLFTFPPKQELKLKLKDLLEDEVDEKYYLSGERVVELIYKIQNQIKELPSCCDSTINDPQIRDVCNCITARYNAGIQNQKQIGMCVIEEPKCIKVAQMYGTEREPNPQTGRIYDSDGISPTAVAVKSLWTETQAKMITKEGNVKRYIDSDVVDEFKEGQVADISFPNGYNKGPRVHDECPAINGTTTASSFIVKTKNGLKIPLYKDTKQLRTIEQNDLYKGEVVNLDLYNRSVYEVSQALTEPHHNSQRLWDGLRIRKLTPKECWRLMGFTDEDFEKVAKVNSNAQLYKQAGNSIVVNVLMAIFNNLLKGK
jgi:DNA-cytosine methyltransferase